MAARTLPLAQQVYVLLYNSLMHMLSATRPMTARPDPLVVVPNAEHIAHGATLALGTHLLFLDAAAQ